MNEKYFMIVSWANRIEEVIVEKETEHFYFVDKKRISKHSRDQIIGKDIDEIKQKMIGQINDEISYLKQRIEGRKLKIQKIHDL